MKMPTFFAMLVTVSFAMGCDSSPERPQPSDGATDANRAVDASPDAADATAQPSDAADATSQPADATDATTQPADATDATPDVTSANAVTKDDITWSFDQAYAVGQFITGDWYVVAPSGMEVTAITTSGDDPLGGSMKNPAPIGRQGYDPIHEYTEHATYDASLNVGLSLPTSLAPGDKLVSTTLYRFYNVKNPDGAFSQTGLEQGAILTVLASVPPRGSFRPGLCDEDNVIYNESAINYSLLADLTPVAGGPGLASITDRVSRPWIDHFPGWPGRVIHPNHNMRDYGGKLVGDIGKAALMANCSFSQAEKRPLVIGLIQMGLDFYSNVKRRRSFYRPTVAHMLGRKFPIMFAGNMLNIQEIKDVWPKTGAYLHTTWGTYPDDAKKFSEDMLVQYVRQEDITVTESGRAYYQPDYDYTTAMIGMPEWFHRNYAERKDCTSSWTTDNYRSTYEAIAGEILAVRIMGWISQWNNQAMFDYMDRYHAIAKGLPDPFGYTVHGETTGRTGYGGSGWNDAMWYEHRPNF